LQKKIANKHEGGTDQDAPNVSKNVGSNPSNKKDQADNGIKKARQKRKENKREFSKKNPRTKVPSSENTILTLKLLYRKCSNRHCNVSSCIQFKLIPLCWTSTDMICFLFLSSSISLVSVSYSEKFHKL